MRALNIVLGLAVVLVVAWLTTLLLEGDGAGINEESRGLPASTGRQELGSDQGQVQKGTSDPSRLPSESISHVPAATSEDEAATKGSIVAMVFSDDGAEVIDPHVRIEPELGAAIPRAEGGFEIRDLPPENYRVTIWNEGLVPRSFPVVEVRAGQATNLQIKLERGIVPRGRVIDETTHQGIEGALVQIGQVSFRSGRDGRFGSEHAIPKFDFRRITITHPDYDTTLHDALGNMDPGNIELSMTRGPSSITGRIINKTGRLTPSHFRLQLFRMLGSKKRQLRRDTTVKASESFELEGIHQGRYVLQVDFPERPISARLYEFNVGFKERKKLDIELDRASDLKGRLMSHGKGRAHLPVELLDEKGFVISRTRSDAEGRFSVLSVPTGAYRLRVDLGGPQKVHFGGVRIADRPVSIIADMDTHRLSLTLLGKDG